MLSGSGRFVIEEYGIWDNGKKLSWLELCRVLNDLDTLANTDLNEYELITRLQNENKQLKQKLEDIKDLSYKAKQYLEDIDSIIEDEGLLK